MPCPVCIGYEVADEARSTQRYDDEEELDALWKKIDKMLAKEKGEDGNESESSESADDED
ncbi:hypothetical protein C8R44DRAFT_765555 [Mycena epipterygia]|nr:hypothetical protein C8R44DRAFT_765555 [Mycena epipterygia]